MTWIKRIPANHKCELPEDSNDVEPGSVWQCDECGSSFMLVRYIRVCGIPVLLSRDGSYVAVWDKIPDDKESINIPMLEGDYYGVGEVY